MMDPISFATLLLFCKIIGTVTTLITLPIGVFKVISWVKNKFNSIDNNVVELKNSLNSHFDALRSDVQEQTKTIAGALSEQRQDFRTFYNPLLMLQQAQAQQLATPVRAKRASRKPIRKK